MIEVIIIIFFGLDMLFSYDYLKRFKTRHPNKDWGVVERNPIIRACVKQLGLGQGMLVGTMCVLVMITVVMLSISLYFKYFLAGVFFMVNVQHFANLSALRELNKIKENLKGGNIK